MYKKIKRKTILFFGGSFLCMVAVVSILSFVADTSPILKSQLIKNSCLYETDKENCYAKEFKEVTQSKSITFAKDTLAKLQQIDKKNARGCHLIAHAISIAETNKEPEKWIELFKSQEVNWCSGGFLHGVLEAHMGHNPSFVLNAEQFKTICNQLENERGVLSCTHNLGHLLLVQENNDLTKAVNICNTIQNFNERYECLSGTFMENITRLNLEAHGISQTIPWNKENTALVEEQCKSYADLPAQACWKVMSYMYASIYKSNPTDVFAACNNTPTKKTAEECYIYGAGNMVTFNSFKKENLTKVCAVYQPNDPLYKRCLMQVVGGLMNSSLSFSDDVIAFCSSAEAFKEECFNKFGATLNYRDTTQQNNLKQQYCLKIPQKFQQSCLEG